MGDDNNNNDNNEYWTCCNNRQTLFILFYITFSVIVLMTMNTLIAKPIRLMGTFCHEISHAIACWMTGGTVHKIHVYDNEGGITQYHGGARCLIIPAGYIGCSVWSSLFVIFSGGPKAATGAAIILLICLLVTLCYSPNRTMIYLVMSYSIVIILCLYLEWWNERWPPMIQYIVLLFGIYMGWIAIYDIYRDTIARVSPRSDAYALYEEVYCSNPCCSSQCIGIQWMIVATLFQWFSIWVALVQMSTECYEISWLSCMAIASSWDNEPNIIDYFRNFFQDIGRNFEFDGFFRRNHHD